MGFPVSPLGISVELAVGAALTASPSSLRWTDITRYVRANGRCVITRGRTDRYTQAPPAKCALELDNDGRFTPDNPTSAYYGLIGLNTPLRVLIRPDTTSASDSFTRTVAAGWGSATVGGAWTISGTAADFSVNATFARHTHTAASAPHYSVLSASLLRSDITARVRVNALSTGAAQTVACVSRYASANASNRVELRFNTDQTLSLRIVQRVGGVDSSGTSFTVSGLTHSTSAWYWMRVQVGQSTVRAKAWLDGTSEPSTWNLDGSDGVATSNATAGQCGVFSVREVGNTNASATLDFDDFGLLDGPRIQYTGYVDSWPSRWLDASTRQAIVPITASGQLRRLQTTPALRSALYQGFTTSAYAGQPDAVGYWPMEDSATSRSFASGIGGPPMLMGGFTPASDSGFAGSDSLPVAQVNGGNFSGPIRAYTSPTPNAWSVQMMVKLPTVASATTTLLSITSAGTVSRWVWGIFTGAPDTIRLQGFTGAGSSTEVLGSAGTNFTNSAGTELYNTNLYITMSVQQNGANVDWGLQHTYIGTNGLPASGSTAGSYAGTLGNISRIYHQGAPGFAAGGYTIGHVAAGRTTALGPTGANAITAYAGETSVDRFSRLCAGSDVPAFAGDLLAGTLGSSAQLMGAQQTGSLVSLLREIEATEEGVLHDGKQGHLTLLPRNLRRSRATALTLNVSTGQVSPTFEPEYDDFAFKNDVTASRPGGSAARVLAAGARAPSVVGAYTDPITANTYTDVELAQHAAWRASVGSENGRRFPSVQLSLDANPSLLDTWLGCDVGYRVAVTGLTSLPVLDPTPLDLLIEGYTEVIDGVTYNVTMNCSPAAPWDAFTWNSSSGNLGRFDTQGTSLMAAYTSADTTMRIAAANSPYGLANTPVWSTTAPPYDWGVAGERIRVNTMTTSAAAFVAAGTAAHGNNTSLLPGMPAGIQKGDLILVLAAIRNTAATANSVSAPGGWVRLVDGGNVCLYGQLWDGSFTAPTVGFQGGSAGDTTSAQIAAFRYTQCLQSGPVPVAQSNALAANIAVPSVESRRQRCIAIAVGWRQTSWTSVAPMGSWTEIGDTSSALGSTQGIVWDFQVMSGSTTFFGGNSFTVTGGVNGISKSFVVALAADVQEATVTRSRNGVVKPQSLAAAVSLWRPGRIAL